MFINEHDDFILKLRTRKTKTKNINNNIPTYENILKNNIFYVLCTNDIKYIKRKDKDDI